MIAVQMTRLIFGVDKGHLEDVTGSLDEFSGDKEVDFLSCDLFPPPDIATSSQMDDLNSVNLGRAGVFGTLPVNAVDQALSNHLWRSNIVGKVSNWIDLDADDSTTGNNGFNNFRVLSEEVLRRENAWCNHLNLQALILPTPKSMSPNNYGRQLNQLCHRPDSSLPYRSYWIHIPYNLDDPNANSWKLWNNLRMIVHHDPQVNVLLELNLTELQVNTNLLASPTDILKIQRWIAEPLKGIILHTSDFSMNNAGFPVLSSPFQQILGCFLDHKIHIIFRGASMHRSKTYTPYVQYIKHLASHYREVGVGLRNSNNCIGKGVYKGSMNGDTLPASLEATRKLIESYQDRLQAPLQPLMDNLENETYETFEADRFKYNQYESALVEAIKDWIAVRSSNSSNENDELVITVVGAGRGPLVDASLNAAKLLLEGGDDHSQFSYKIIVIEKNENAIVTLQNKFPSEYFPQVTLYWTDMRDYHPLSTELSDILVSELLGSWGDNELSPECLDAAQICLKESGVSIPSAYTSYIAPLSSAKLWMAARDTLDNDRGLDTPFVVNMHACWQITQAKPLFTFEHPSWSATETGKQDIPERSPTILNKSETQKKNTADKKRKFVDSDETPFNSMLSKQTLAIRNKRYAKVKFSDFPCDAIVHGLHGSFIALLYRKRSHRQQGKDGSVNEPVKYNEDSDILLSIHPERPNEEMTSWFPLFVPFRTPILVNSGESIEVCVWRCGDARNMWYEWCIASPNATQVQNTCGEKYKIGL